MSGKYKGVAARILGINHFATYCHCQCHSLSLCVCFSCKLLAVVNMMNKLRCVQEFFEYPKRAEELEKKILLLLPTEEKRRKLKNCCRTRWLEKIESFDIFTEMYPAVVASLTYISTNTGGHWNNDSITLASSLLKWYYHLQFFDNTCGC